MAELFFNNVGGELAADIASGDTSITLQSGHNFTDPGAGNFYRATLHQQETNYEIVHVTAVSSNTLTIERGKEGTSARAFVASDPIEHRWTAGAADRLANEWVVKTSAHTASNLDRILADTSGSAFTITMPGDPLTGDAVWFTDGGRSWDANALTVNGNGNNIMGEPDLVANNRDASFALTYNGTQWILGAN